MSRAQLASAVRISRALGVTVVSDTSADRGGGADAVAAGAVAWDGTAASAGDVFTD